MNFRDLCRDYETKVRELRVTTGFRKLQRRDFYFFVEGILIAIIVAVTAFLYLFGMEGIFESGSVGGQIGFVVVIIAAAICLIMVLDQIKMSKHPEDLMSREMYLARRRECLAEVLEEYGINVNALKLGDVDSLITAVGREKEIRTEEGTWIYALKVLERLFWKAIFPVVTFFLGAYMSTVISDRTLALKISTAVIVIAILMIAAGILYRSDIRKVIFYSSFDVYDDMIHDLHELFVFEMPKEREKAEPGMNPNGG